MALQTFQPAIHPDIDPHSRLLFQLLFNVANNHAKAIVSKTAAAGTTNVTNINETAGGVTPGGTAWGTVSNQVGLTAYTTGPGDSGALVVLGDAAPIALTLGVGVSAPWMAFFSNIDVGLATFTPASGTISYPGNPAAASMPLPGGYGCTVAFDGTNFWALTEPIAPESFTAATHKFFKSYDAATGIFTDAQPDFTDISGTIAVGQLPASGVTPGSYTNTNLTVDAEGRVTAAANGTSSGLNFADAEIPAGVVDGANVTFTLANTPTPALSLQLYLNGLIQHQGIGNDYTLSAATITFASAPSIGGTVLAWYRY